MDCFKTLFLMDIFNERFYTAFIMKNFFSFVFRVAFIGEVDFDSRVEKSLFAKAYKKGIVFIFKGLENLVIRFEKNGSTFFVGITDNFKVAFGNSAFKALFINVLAVFDFNFKPFGKGVYYRSAYAMKTAGYFISGTAEFTARMKNGENNGYCRDSEFCVDTDGDSSAVIRYTNKVSGKDFNIDIGAITRKGFVDCVVDNFINKVMKTFRSGGTDIHTGSFSYCFKSFKDLDLVFVVGFLHGFYGKRSIFHDLPPEYFSAKAVDFLKLPSQRGRGTIAERQWWMRDF